MLMDKFISCFHHKIEMRMQRGSLAFINTQGVAKFLEKIGNEIAYMITPL